MHVRGFSAIHYFVRNYRKAAPKFYDAIRKRLDFNLVQFHI